MKRKYSMKNRRLNPSIISKFNEVEKCDIMTKYLVQKMELSAIYEYYRGRGVALNYFIQMPSRLIEDKEIMSKVMNRIMTDVTFIERKLEATCVGHKTQSYWETEDDLFYTPIKMNELSKDEKLIYFSKPRKNNNYGKRTTLL